MDSQLIAHLRESDNTPQKLQDHLLETAAIAAKFTGSIGLTDVGELLGLLHDLGKAGQGCQNYLNSAFGIIDPDDIDYVDYESMKGKIDHSSAGAQYVYQKLSGKGKGENIAAQVFALCIASHHSGLIDCISPEGEDKFSKRINKSDESTHTEEAVHKCMDFITEEIDNQHFLEKSKTELISKFLSLKEQEDSPDTLLFKDGLLIRFLLSCLIDADRLNTADFESPDKSSLRNYSEYKSWDILIQRLNSKLAEFKNSSENNSINGLRTAVSEACFLSHKKPKGIFQLKVPTGGGKTLASLRFALNHASFHKMERIIYVIPYTSIIDQNADEVRKILEDKDLSGKYLNNIVLEHHSNLTPEKETTKQKLLAENWDAPIVFTTQVQFLEALFGSGTRSIRRMHQLANSVIIFDEVQTIPIRCVHMFNLSLRFLVHGCGSTVVLCTATQPLLNKVIPANRALKITEEQQLVSSDKINSFRLKRNNIFDLRKIGGWTDEEVSKLAERELRENGSVLIIVNTKKSARSLYQTISEKGYKDDVVFHLSTNMCPVHRMEVLNTIRARLEKKEPVICISTQLIEAGVDIDFGSAIRYLAGIDSIVQAAGRCNRNGIRKNGNVWIINPSDENIEKIPEIKIGSAVTERVLGEFEISSDDKKVEIDDKLLDTFYEYYFYDRKSEMSYPVGINSIIGRDDNLFSILSDNSLSIGEYKRINNDSLPDIPFKQSFQSAAKDFWAIESFTRGVIVQYEAAGKKLVTDLCGSNEIKKEYHLLRVAQRYSVNLFAYEFENLLKISAIYETKKGSGIYYLDRQYYDGKIGWCSEAVNPMETNTI